jgi:hypothetical protein
MHRDIGGSCKIEFHAAAADLEHGNREQWLCAIAASYHDGFLALPCQD